MDMTKVEEVLVSPFGESTATVWRGSGFLVGLFAFQGIYRLSVERTEGDKYRLMSWEELQEIKRACGFGDIEAVEVYPRDSDIMNTGNIRHLYLMDHLIPFAMRVKPPVLQKSNPSVNGEQNG